MKTSINNWQNIFLKNWFTNAQKISHKKRCLDENYLKQLLSGYKLVLLASVFLALSSFHKPYINNIPLNLNQKLFWYKDQLKSKYFIYKAQSNDTVHVRIINLAKHTHQTLANSIIEKNQCLQIPINKICQEDSLPNNLVISIKINNKFYLKTIETN